MMQIKTDLWADNAQGKIKGCSQFLRRTLPKFNPKEVYLGVLCGVLQDEVPRVLHPQR